MVTSIVNIWIWLIFLAIVLVLILPLLDIILNTEVLTAIDWILNNIEYFVGSENLNIFLILIATTLLLIVFKFLFKFFKTEN